MRKAVSEIGVIGHGPMIRTAFLMGDEPVFTPHNIPVVTNAAKSIP